MVQYGHTGFPTLPGNANTSVLCTRQMDLYLRFPPSKFLPCR